MVYSQLSNLSKYVEPYVFERIKQFLDIVNEDMEEGMYPIMGDEVFARVMSYDTKTPEACKIEAHDKYIDIQATISGAEGISVYNRERLCACSEYNAKKDVVLYQATQEDVIAYTVNNPGYFTMLFPEDAHRPQERVGNIDGVKKFVIKLSVS